MAQALGDILPLALGVAISPVPIIAVILMLLSPRAGASSTAFLVGWVLGVTLVVTIVTLVVNPTASDDTSKPSLVASIAKMVLGLAAAALGVKEWRGRPAPGEPAKLPSWMAAIDGITPVKALGLAALLAGVNPKNLTLCLAGGVSIGGAGLSTSETVVALAVFVVIASTSVAVPVLGYLLAHDQMTAPLDRLRTWLTANNAAVMSVLLLVIGTAIFGKGLGGL